jgi:hypothetical protein
VGDRGPVYLDVVIITEIQELLLGERSVVVSDDGVWDPEMENNVLDKIYCLVGANLSQGPCPDPLSELVDCNKQVGQAYGHFLEGPQKVQAQYGKRPCNGDGMEVLGRSVNLPQEVSRSNALPSSIRMHH